MLERDSETTLPVFKLDYSKVQNPSEGYYGFGLEGEALDAAVLSLAEMIDNAWNKELAEKDDVYQWQRYTRVYNRVQEAIGGRELAQNVWIQAASWRNSATEDTHRQIGHKVVDTFLTRTILSGARRVVKKHPEFFVGRTAFSPYDEIDALALQAQFSAHISEDEFMDSMLIDNLGAVDGFIATHAESDTLATLPMYINTRAFNRGSKWVSVQTGLPDIWIKEAKHLEIAFWTQQFRLQTGRKPSLVDVKNAFGPMNHESENVTRRLIGGLPLLEFAPESALEQISNDSDSRPQEISDSYFKLSNHDLQSTLHRLNLTEREIQILKHRFGLDDGKPKTLEEVGQIFDVTRERIRQIENKAIKKMSSPDRLT